MAPTYLQHPRHGIKVAYTDPEIKHDKENGWTEWDPSSVTQQEATPVVPAVVPSPPPPPPAPVVPAGLPAGLPGGAATGVVTNVPPGLPVTSDLAADFPGREALAEAGLTNWVQLVGKTKEELMAVKGIGDATATKILGILEG